MALARVVVIYAVVAVPNWCCGFDNCGSNSLMLLLTKWLLLLLWSRYSSKRECDRSVHCLWQPRDWARSHRTSSEPFRSICYSEVTNRVGRMLGLSRRDKSCRNRPACERYATYWAHVNLLWHDLSRLVLRVLRVMSAASVSRRQYFCIILLNVTIWGQGTLVLVVW